MNKSLIFNEIFDETIMYCSNYITYELDWVNDFTEKKFGKVKPGQKCYEYFCCADKPCKGCQNNTIVNNIKKYTNESYISKSAIPVGLEQYAIEDRIVSSEKNKKLSILYSYDSMIKMEASSKIKQTYNVLLNKILKIDLEDNNHSKLTLLINAIQELFCSDRAVLVNKTINDFKPIESRKTSINTFEFDNDINKRVDDLVEKRKSGQKKKFLHFNTTEIEKDDSQLATLLSDKGIYNAIFMKWKTEHQEFNLIIENVGVDYFDEELLLIIYNFCDLVLSLFFYNDMLFHLSNKDSLTGLFNRNYYNYYLIELGKIDKHSIGILFCDLDNLKEINDTYGHSIGDRVLKKIASVLQAKFSKEKICRIGGDEFVVIALGVNKTDFNEMLDSFCEDLKNNNISCSVGSAYKARGNDIIQIIEEAENDMYYFKEKHHQKRKLNNGLQNFRSFVQQDIENKRFLPLFQPVVDAKTKEIISAELLIRGVQKDGKMKLPEAFIPLFIKNQCIDLIDFYMIEQACIISNQLKQQNINFPISINLARKTMDKTNFVSDVNNIFAKYGVEKNKIHFEIIESPSLSLDDIVEIVLQLKQEGYVLELDGFATNFSSVSILTMNVFSRIKMGEQVLREARTNDFAKEILRTIINKSLELGIVVSAKEIETKEQLELVKELKFNEIQGNIFYEPTSVEDFIEQYLKNK